MDNILISKMTPEDISQVKQLEDEQNINILSKESITDDLSKDNYYYIVAKKENNIIGYLGASFLLDTADLISVVVKQEEKRKGIASSLLLILYRYLKEQNVKKILLEVRESNLIAQKTYINHGFNVISRRKNYYGNESAIIMEKTI